LFSQLKNDSCSEKALTLLSPIGRGGEIVLEKSLKIGVRER